MTDIALSWDNAAWRADIGLARGDLATDDGLRTAVLISLFTDAPARDDDPLPAPGYRGGWWGDGGGRAATHRTAPSARTGPTAGP